MNPIHYFKQKSNYREASRHSVFIVFFFYLLSGVFLQEASAQSYAVCDTIGLPLNFEMDGNLSANTIFSGSDDWFVSPGLGTGVIGTTAASAMPPLQISAAAFKSILQSAATPAARNLRYEQRMSVPIATPRPTATGYNVFYDAVAARDNFSGTGTSDSSVFGTARNGDNPLTAWSVAQGALSYKFDIIDLGAHFRREYADTTVVLNPFTPLADTIDTIVGRDIWGYGFMTTFNPDGDNYIDFEFFRSKPAMDASLGSVTNSGPSLTGGHTRYYFDSLAKATEVGDAIFSINYALGATSPVVSVRVWVNPSQLGPGITGFSDFNTKSKRPFEFTGVFTAGSNTSGYGYAEIRPRGIQPSCIFFSRTNNVVVSGCKIPATPWGTIGYPSNNPYSDSIPCLKFTEFSMNLTKFGLEGIVGGIDCATPNAFMVVKTRSSALFDADARDFAGPYTLGNIINANAGPDKSITCSKTTATLYGSTYTPYGVVQWSVVPGSGGHIVSGANTLTPVVDSAGIYVLSVSNAPPLQCTVTDSVVVTSDRGTPTLTASSSNDITCNTPTSTLSVVATPSGSNTITSYLWSNGATTSSTTTSTPGTYTVTVTQSNGCTSSASTTVGSNVCTPTVSVSNSGPITCTNTSVTLSAIASACAGNTIVSYLWSNGATTTSASVTTSGTYTLTVTQSNGCTSSASTTVISDVCTPIVSASNSGPITCTNTMVTLSANATACSGNSIVSYLWSNGATTAITSTSIAGAFSVTVTQSNGCTFTSSTVVAADTASPSVNCSVSGTINCINPVAILTANANPAASNGIVSYNWSPGGFTTNSIGVYDGDTYTVTVTQTNGCTASSSCSAVVDTCKPVVAPTQNGPINCSNSSVLVQANATACSGQTLSYSWSNGFTTSSISTSSAGVYSVTVSQAPNGCTASGSVTVASDFSVPTISCSASGSITCINTTAQITASATPASGSTIVSYSWSPGGQTTPSITVSDGSTYSVTVTQSNGCTASSDCFAPVDTCKPAVIVFNGGPIKCNNPLPVVSANVTACSGESVYYLWSNGSVAPFFSTSTPGTYSVTVTQINNGCTNSGSTVLSIDTCRPTVTASNSGPITCSNSSPSVSAQVIACPGQSVSYLWNNGNNSANFNTGTPGTYSVVVTQLGNGCTNSATTTVTAEGSTPTVSASSSNVITCAQPSATVSATATASTGNTISTYLWSPGGQTTASFTTS
ncbi:MAG: hypothetical protein ACKO1U_00995, partial [Bacteroidota bacterium]